MKIQKVASLAAVFFFFAVLGSPRFIGVANSGTTGKIVGQVVDKQNNEPLPGASILIEGTTMGASVDVNGFYTILQVPPGTYTLVAKMIGYKEVRISNVRVRADLTTRTNFSLEQTVLAGEAVTIVAERPLVITDLTASSTRVNSSEIEDIPNVSSVTDAVQLMPGVVGEGENLHVRGGRSGEVVYMVDGVAVNDPLFNNQIVSVNKYSVQEIELLTGGYNAEYGNAQSGIVNVITRTGGTKFSGRVAYFSDHLIGSGRYPSDILNVANPLDVPSIQVFRGEGPGIRKNSLNTDRWEANFGGPEPITNSILPALGFEGLKGKVNFFVSGNAETSDGYLPNEDQSATLTHFTESFTPSSDVVEAGEAPSVQFTGAGQKIKHPFVQDFLGIDWGGRFINNLSYTARLSYRISNNINSSLSYVGSQFWQDSYRHTYRYQMDHTQQTEGKNFSLIFNWNHSLSPNSFYQVSIGVLNNRRFQYPGMRNGIRLTPEFMNNRLEDGDDSFFPGSLLQNLDDPNDPLNSDTADELAGLTDPRAGAYQFGYNGASTWAQHRTLTYTLKADYLAQLTRNHEVKIGFDWKYNDLKQQQIDFGGNKVPSRRINPPDDGPYVTSGALRDFYTRFPNTGAAYVQDKIEFESLIVNVGLRYDRFDPGSQVFEIGEAFLTADAPRKPVNSKNYLSPRVGISHPITDRSRFYFFYGRFVQIPTLSELYRRQNRFRIFQNQLNTFGNPDLEAEETVSYEVGFDHQLTDDIKFGVTGFFKDIRNQINLETFGPEAAPFQKLVNRDFGNDRGFEFDFIKRFSHYFSANINYTLMWASTRSSTFARGIGALGGRTFPNVQEVPSDWDQRHTINANLHFEIPAGRGLKLFGANIDRTSLIVFWRYGSGLPFTISEDADPNATVNSARLPFFSLVDIRLRKDIRLVRNFFTTFYLDVNNLFNRRNVLSLVGDAEHSCIECTLTDPKTGQVVVKNFPHGNVEGDGSAADLLPSQLGAPRQILLGFGFRF